MDYQAQNIAKNLEKSQLAKIADAKNNYVVPEHLKEQEKTGLFGW